MLRIISQSSEKWRPQYHPERKEKSILLYFPASVNKQTHVLYKLKTLDIPLRYTGLQTVERGMSQVNSKG